jgi:hypothetical protein
MEVTTSFCEPSTGKESWAPNGTYTPTPTPRFFTPRFPATPRDGTTPTPFVFFDSGKSIVACAGDGANGSVAGARKNLKLGKTSRPPTSASSVPTVERLAGLWKMPLTSPGAATTASAMPTLRAPCSGT